MNISTRLRQAATIAGAAFFLSNAALASGKNDVTYEVTITNLTSGQPFTPPVIAVHNRRADVFSLGDSASEGIRSIAENGNNAPLVTALSSDYNVNQVLEGTAPIVPVGNPGGAPFDSQVTFSITVDRYATHLSFVSMLICTNDGFTGLDAVRLPRWKKTVYSRAYETRTEQNTEDFADIVPPCQGLIGASSDDAGTGQSNPLLSENGVIIPHIGVIGDNDLDSRIHDWTDPVAKIEIKRVSRRY